MAQRRARESMENEEEDQPPRNRRRVDPNSNNNFVPPILPRTIRESEQDIPPTFFRNLRIQDRRERWATIIVGGDFELPEGGGFEINVVNIKTVVNSILTYLLETHRDFFRQQKGGILFKIKWRDGNGIRTFDSWFTLKEVIWDNSIPAIRFDKDKLVDAIVTNFIEMPMQAPTEEYQNQAFTGFNIFIVDRSREIRPNFARNEIIRWNNESYIVDAEEEEEFIEDEENGFCREDKKKGEIVYIKGQTVFSVACEHGYCFVSACAHSLKKQCKYIKRDKLNFRFDKSCGTYLATSGFPLEKLEKAADFFGTDIIVFGIDERAEDVKEELVVIAESRKLRGGGKHIAKVFLHENHYYAYMYPIPQGEKSVKGVKCEKCYNYHKGRHTCNKVKCFNCGVAIKPTNMDAHMQQCRIQQSNWHNMIQFRKQGKSTVVSNIKYIDSYDPDKNVIIYDIETHIDEFGTHKPYAIGWLVEGKKYYSAYGYLCIDKFFSDLNYLEAHEENNDNDVLKPEKKRWKLIGYNNAKYDNNFLVSWLIKNGSSSLRIVNSGCAGIITFSFKNDYFVDIVAIDLLKFLLRGSLKSVCASFKLPVQKGDFPYDFVNDKKDIYFIGPIPSPNYWKEVPDNYCESDNEWDLAVECLTYLQKDVMCTYEVYKAFGQNIFDAFRVNFTDFVTLSHMSYEIWASFVTPNINFKSSNTWHWEKENIERPTQLSTKINIPNINLNNAIYGAIYGGRVMPIKKYFCSERYAEIKEGRLLYDQIYSDYILMLDVVSQYPAAMAHNPYPMGDAETVTPEEIDNLNKNYKTMGGLPMGIYEVEYLPNPTLIIPILPRKNVKIDKFGRRTSESGLHWDLHSSRGFYTNVDLEMAIESGYKITFLSGVKWRQSGFLFKDFIYLCFNIKVRAEREKNPVLRQIAKIMMNSLYGKMLQKPIIDKLKVIKNITDAAKFMEKYILTDIITMEGDDDDFAIFKGVSSDVEAHIRKPSQFGAFILSYSRKILYDYNKKLDPYALTNSDKSLVRSMFYGDTDSMYIYVTPEIWQIIQEFYDAERLGAMFNDDKDNLGKVIKAVFLGPKCYMVEILGKDNVIRTSMKCCGMPKHLLTAEMYENVLFGYPEKNKVAYVQGFKKTGATNWCDLNPFEVVTHYFKKTFINKNWIGRYFNPKLEYFASYPHGFIGNGDENEEEEFE